MLQEVAACADADKVNPAPAPSSGSALPTLAVVAIVLAAVIVSGTVAIVVLRRATARRQEAAKNAEAAGSEVLLSATHEDSYLELPK